MLNAMPTPIARIPNRRLAETVLAAVLIAAGLTGCYRPAPPDVPEFHAPAEPVRKEIEKVAASDTVAPTPTPETTTMPTPTPVPGAPVELAASPTPTPPPTAEAPAAPSIVGRWQMTEMSHNGQSHPLPDGMTMIYEFGADGSTLTINVSGGKLPSPQTMTGSYSVSGDQITFTMHDHSQSGTFRFEGDNVLVIEADGGVVRFNRA